jgi:hypothetical protein
MISRRYEAIQVAIQVGLCVAQNSRRLVQRRHVHRCGPQALSVTSPRDVRPCRPTREHNLMGDVIVTIIVMN